VSSLPADRRRCGIVRAQCRPLAPRDKSGQRGPSTLPRNSRSGAPDIHQRRHRCECPGCQRFAAYFLALGRIADAQTENPSPKLPSTILNRTSLSVRRGPDLHSLITLTGFGPLRLRRPGRLTRPLSWSVGITRTPPGEPPRWSVPSRPSADTAVTERDRVSRPEMSVKGAVRSSKSSASCGSASGGKPPTVWCNETCVGCQLHVTLRGDLLFPKWRRG
jgi:hypothetical protein